MLMDNTDILNDMQILDTCKAEPFEKAIDDEMIQWLAYWINAG